MNDQLAKDEQRLLQDCEQTINASLHTFYAVGKALLTIRDRRLYRETHRTFKEYCKERWHFTARHAYHQIAAYEFCETLSKTDPFPTNEKQLRPLQALPPGERVQAWKEAHALALAEELDKVAVRQVTESSESLRRRTGGRKPSKITLRLCIVCQYSFSDEHHLKAQSSGGRHFEKIALCPNHHRYATILQQQVLDDYPREGIEAFAAKHFDSAFNTQLLPHILNRTYEISKDLSDSFDLFTGSTR